MPTSGTTGLTTLPIDELVESACRRCGVSSGSMPGEAARIGKQALFAFLVTTSNDGTNLWVVNKYIMPLTTTQTQITLPVSTVGIKAALYRRFVAPSGGSPFSSAGGSAANAFDRDIQTVCTQVSANGYISYDFGQSVVIYMGGLMSNGDAGYTLAWESSKDNVTWTQVLQSEGAIYPDKKWVYTDFTETLHGRYFRVRETGGATLNVREIAFASNIYETTMTSMNIDNYAAIPNKTLFQGTSNGSNVLQYYFDRRRTQPIMDLWPAPTNSFDCVVLYLHMHPQDVGAMTNELDVPVRWVDAVTWGLAAKMIYELPRDIVDWERVGNIERNAEIAKQKVSDEERNPSPIYMLPNISGYTK